MGGTKTYLSVATLSLAIPVKSSWLVLADMLVRGVPVVDPIVEPFGVDVDVEASVPLEACFAAFSARRFCLEAEGAIFYSIKLS